MLKSYLKIIYNNFLQQKLFSLINILGMAVGLACCLLISLYVMFEFSYDEYHEKADRIYRISYVFSSGNRLSDSALVAPALVEDFAEIEEVVRIYGNTPGLISRGEEAYYEEGVRFADNSVFRIFDFEWLQGDPQTALASPNTVVLTERMAEKYFPGENPLGQTLYLSTDRIPMTVTGIIRDLPDNTHLSISMLGSMDLGVTRSGRSTQDVLENWNFRIFNTYVLLREGTDIDLFRSELPAFVERRMPFVTPTFLGLEAMNIRDIHFNSKQVGDWKETGNVVPLLILSAVAVCILLIACINFMNLSTARSSRRAQEIGMRKVLGAERSKLIIQFLGESVLMTMLAMCIAFMLVELALPAFNAFVGKTLSLGFIGWEKLVLGMIAFAVFTGIAAGSYPAFFLSSYQAAKVLKGEVSRGRAGVLFRNILVLAQFSISIFLIVATAVVYKQMDFARNTDLGFKKDEMVILEGSLQNKLGPQWRLLRDRLQQHPDILGAAASNVVPLAVELSPSFVTTPGIEDELQLYAYQIGPKFFDTYGMEVIAGRGFSEDFPADQGVYPTTAGEVGSQSFVLSEEALRVIGWTAEEALGKQLSMPRPEYVEGGMISGPVVGVVTDALFESVRDTVKPLFYMMPPDTITSLGLQYSRLTVSMRTENVNATMADIASIWEEYNPETEMRSRFLEADFNLVYQDEDKQGEMFRYFAGIAIILACFGLFGLAAFNAERRTKEIGVRKVMGGSVWSIVLLLTNDFSKLVLISNLIAWPVAWYAMEQWLANFAYRIDLTPLIFIGSGLIALCIAWVTVGGTAAKAASQRPVLALRYE